MNILSEKTLAHIFAKSGKAVDRKLEERKSELFRNLGGTVLEIGPGREGCLRYFPDGINYIAVEPNPYFAESLRRAANKARCGRVLITRDKAESMKFVDGVTDAVVCSLVLCSVKDERAALSEIYRVLKPGGIFYFIEHVVAKHLLMRFVQKLIKPICIIFRGGCHPDRDTLGNISALPWKVSCVTVMLKGMPYAPFILGKALKPKP